MAADTTLRFLSALWQLNRRMKADMAPILAEQRLDLRLYFTLLTVRKGALYPKQLSEQLDFPPALLSRYLEQLSKLGYLERQLDPADSRRIRLSLTQSGEAALDAAVQGVRTSAAQTLAHTEQSDLLALLTVMETLAAGPASPPPVSKPRRTRTPKEPV
ncbi:MarR family winged helix-turn-helix transcriptional regulator [Deinococcus lacus]|uniref:MarR family winged helix-turn-helix transcriptional regulator n=1 Tax=Deinococcus lacus TaxID=392561 RepID=A0ABW1YF36_9DEIO